MTGTTKMATSVMILSVFWLDVASQIVKLCDGIKLDGMIIGNSATPAVKIMHAIARLENKNAPPDARFRLAHMHANKLAMPTQGINHSMACA